MRYAEYLERTQFSKEELIASSMGTLIDDPPPGDMGRLPAPPFLMFDRVVDIQHGQRGGRIIAELDVRLDAWYFFCHFAGDPVQPGCLGVDAIWQLMGFFASVNGARGAGRALGCQSVEFFGQIRPHDKLVRYEVDVKRLILKSEARFAVGDGRVYVDGHEIYKVWGAKIGIFDNIKYGDFPRRDNPNARGGIIQS